MYPRFFSAITGEGYLHFHQALTFSFSKLQGTAVARNKVTVNYEFCPAIKFLTCKYLVLMDQIDWAGYGLDPN